MENLKNLFLTIDGYIGGSSWFVFLLLGTGFFFTIYLKFPQIRYFKYTFKILRGKLDDKDSKGDATHFQALATALSGTVGTGNIAGVALALHLGGPAALFWMLVTAFLGMCTKFVEVTLSHKYRETASDGTVAGGPMYYMKNKLNMKWLAALFAIATIISCFGTGNLPQINSIANSLYATAGINKVVTGGVLAALLALVILGGIKRIVKVTEKLVPAMAVIYILGALVVIASNYENLIPGAISIFSSVFTGTAAVGGFLGGSFALAFNRGVNRGLFSNEAGQGSAPIAHAAAKAENPVSEGLVALLEPFIDTIVICTITGLVILSTGAWNKKYETHFQVADMSVLETTYEPNNEKDVEKVADFIMNSADLPLFNGLLTINNGVISNDVTVIHARSIAEDVTVIDNKENPYTGSVNVKKGYIKLPDGVVFTGKSLLHSAPLTAAAFSSSVMGDKGAWIISLGLLLFAFSTAISWSYYGGRSIIFLFGTKGLIWFRIVYVIGFFFGAFIDTSIIWAFSGIAIALMTIPNLIGILLLRKDMKSEVNNFMDKYKKKLDS